MCLYDSTYLCLLDQCVQSTDASPVSRGHPIDFVHDKARLVSDGNTERIRRLAHKPLSSHPKNAPPNKKKTTYLFPSHPAIQRCILNVHATLHTKEKKINTRVQHVQNVLASTSFLLRASLALSSIGVNPSSFAHKCALVVLPMPGGPDMSTARKMFIPLLPGFLKPDVKLDDLHPGVGHERKARGGTKDGTNHVATAGASPLAPCSRISPWPSEVHSVSSRAGTPSPASR